MMNLPIGIKAVYHPKIAVVGLGYVGLPVAIALARKFDVTGFDINVDRIGELRDAVDRTREVAPDDLRRYAGIFTYNHADIRGADIYVIAVPTPIDKMNKPDLGPLTSACLTVGKEMGRHNKAIVVFESTVYPGCTEDHCIPVLEGASGMKAGKHFFVGYSPERINPGDKKHRFETIKKIVAGQNEETLGKLAFMYGAVVPAGIHWARSIKVAEAAKIIENTQRDVNIALMNEFAKICNLLEVDTNEVLEAARTKWNFLDFRPGLVGGHCIGVDPYYLTAKAEQLGFNAKVILSGRETNDSMGGYIARAAIKAHSFEPFATSPRVAVLGLTFKENCPDIRNTKVIDIIDSLKHHGCNVQVADPMANVDEARKAYGIDLVPAHKLLPSDIVIVAVAHDEYRGKSGLEIVTRVGRLGATVFDVKSVLPFDELPKRQFKLLRL